MCGIAGQRAFLQAEVDVDEVMSMTEALRHRGPDDHGVFVNASRSCALGMRRLAIIDLVHGQQPVFSEDGSIACVLNGEIYNFVSLRRDLERRGHRFNSNSDTEVVVHLYEDEGIETFKRLRGMFAIAIWDETNDRLVLARDRLGKKPLYYGEINNRLVFASEIQALYGCAGLKREIDEVALDLYLTCSYIPAPHSIYRSLRKLPPGHFMTVDRQGIHRERYWALDPHPLLGASREEIQHAVRDKIMEAVQLRMVSDVPIGCFLSGGVDSSIITASMARASTAPVKTFAIGFANQRFDERQHARVVAQRYATEHHEYVVDARGADVLDDVVRHFGEPFGDSSAIPTWYVARLAREHVTVALNGDGGDEAFAGYPWYMNASRLETIARWAPTSVVRCLSMLPGRRAARWRRFGSRLGMSSGQRFASLRGYLDTDLKRQWYSSDFYQRCGEQADSYLARGFDAADVADLTRMQLTDIRTYLAEGLLVKVDRMSMAHSLEARSPFLDHELIELAMRVPATYQVERGRGKAVVRNAMKSWFPPGFLDRPKMGFSPPVAGWLRGDMADLCKRLVCGAPLLDQGWFEPLKIKALFTEHLTGRHDWGDHIWNLVMLAKWIEVFGR